jgi:hypothetical protein
MRPYIAEAGNEFAFVHLAKNRAPCQPGLVGAIELSEKRILRQ